MGQWANGVGSSVDRVEPRQFPSPNRHVLRPENILIAASRELPPPLRLGGMKMTGVCFFPPEKSTLPVIAIAFFSTGTMMIHNSLGFPKISDPDASWLDGFG